MCIAAPHLCWRYHTQHMMFDFIHISPKDHWSLQRKIPLILCTGLAGTKLFSRSGAKTPHLLSSTFRHLSTVLVPTHSLTLLAQHHAGSMANAKQKRVCICSCVPQHCFSSRSLPSSLVPLSHAKARSFQLMLHCSDYSKVHETIPHQ